MKKDDKVERFDIPDKISVFDDPRTHAKSIALPFQFPDGTNGIVIVSRLNNALWKPHDVIEHLDIKFK